MTAEEVEAARGGGGRGPRLPHFALTVATGVPATIDDLKHVLGNHAGEDEVLLAITTSGGARTLRFGDGFRVKQTPTLRAELEEILGPRALSAPSPA
jgi:hypothetical protein